MQARLGAIFEPYLTEDYHIDALSLFVQENRNADFVVSQGPLLAPPVEERRGTRDGGVISMDAHGHLILVVGPSGAGKDTLIDYARGRLGTNPRLYSCAGS